MTYQVCLVLLYLLENSVFTAAYFPFAYGPVAVPEDYPDRVPGSCGSPFFFDCGNGFCIPFRLVRNCIDDCGNGADEECGTDKVLCDMETDQGCGICISPDRVFSDCQDRKYHPYCQLGAYTRKGVPIFRCATTANCVPFDWLNDGHNDCGDWSDEDPCLDGFFCVAKTITLNQQFTICECINRYSSRGKAWLKPDPLLNRIPGQCYAKTLKFDCGDGTCIDIKRFRDCVTDCLDGSDEACWLGTVHGPDGCTCIVHNNIQLPVVTEEPGDIIVVIPEPEPEPEIIIPIVTPEPIDDICIGEVCPPPSKPDVVVLVINPEEITTGINPIDLLGNGLLREPVHDCTDLRKHIRRLKMPFKDGVYVVNRTNCNGDNCKRKLYCDMTTQGGGWTVIQRRQNGRVSFQRPWAGYKNGFGSYDHEFWLGNDIISELTNTPNRTYELLIQMVGNDGQSSTVKYNRFRIEPEDQFYRLRLGDMVEGSVDSLRVSRDAPFGTYDRQKDGKAAVTCGAWFRSGWWYNNQCALGGNLNVPFRPVAKSPHLKGIQWAISRDDGKSGTVVQTKIMIRQV
ncbi:hypothetical protein M514_07040 [Trichuris suis]|uniref:Fibrinogen C-terminal domain-containing protein n=1 Tax=Trichuris suis TaxID=68888 RepID=A0A085N8S9_9BILA|nr:hypothetical protein M513_07040 [Trichuris suis]KFD65875.1 hypothetical protein M514_07040 [Trichuris suis]KHJ48131.1 hypothetical protein D918_01398 [Trichuris suis]